MKHNFKFYAAMACSAVALASCSSEAIEDAKTAGKKQITFTAQQEPNVSSRTSLGGDLSVLWAGGDVISVFDTENHDFTITNGAGSSTAEFSGTAGTADTYYAVYPYQSGATISGNVISNVVIPAEQKATANTFDPKANIMTAVSNSANNLAFKNVCSYAKITTKAACKKITFTAGASDKIAGTFNMTVGADGIATATATSGVNAVTLVPSSGDTFADGTYYIAINAGTISSLKVECLDVDDVNIVNSIISPVTVFTRGNIIDLGTVSVEDGWDAISCCPDDNHPHMIDLGLNVKWACCNLGANEPSKSGDYYAWGETEPQTDNAYSWTSYTYAIDDYNNLTKYNSDASFGIVDNKTILEEEDDAVIAKWHDTRRMPTASECSELINNTTSKWTTVNGVYGRKFTSKKTGYTNKFIFLPAAGKYTDGAFEGSDEIGNYWFNTRQTSYSYMAGNIEFNNSSHGKLMGGLRYIGRTIRPVCP